MYLACLTRRFLPIFFKKGVDDYREKRYNNDNNLREIFSKGKPGEIQRRKAKGAKPKGMPASCRIVKHDMYDISIAFDDHLVNSPE